jgi:hypothetical protein
MMKINERIRPKDTLTDTIAKRDYPGNLYNKSGHFMDCGGSLKIQRTCGISKEKNT